MTKHLIISNQLFRIAIRLYHHPSKQSIALLEKVCDEVHAPALIRLARYERKLHRLYERQCNGAPDYMHNSDKQAAYKRATDKLIEQAEAKLKTFAAENNITFTLQTDPRAVAIRDVRLTITETTDLTYLIY
jgi:hypothetical protein